MGVRTWIEGWPVYRQLAGGDLLGRGAAAKGPASGRLVARDPKYTVIPQRQRRDRAQATVPGPA